MIIITEPASLELSTWWRSRANESSQCFEPWVDQLGGKLQFIMRLHLTVTTLRLTDRLESRFTNRWCYDSTDEKLGQCLRNSTSYKMFTRERGEEGARRERNGWGGEGSQAEEAHVSLPACQARYEWAFTWIQADCEHWLCWIRVQTEGLHMSLQLLFVQQFVFYNVNQISLVFTPVRRKRRLMATNYKFETFPSFHSHLVWLP